MENLFSDSQVILICGNYNCGKSRLAHRHFRGTEKDKQSGDPAFSENKCSRTVTHGPSRTTREKNEPMIKHIESTILKSLLQQHEKIIIDNTSVTVKSRARYIRETKAFGGTNQLYFHPDAGGHTPGTQPQTGQNRTSAGKRDQSAARHHPAAVQRGGIQNR